MNKHINNVELSGIICTDLKTEKFSDGKRCRSFELETHTEHVNRDGCKTVKKQYHSILLWNSLCDIAESFKPNDLIWLRGRLENKHYTDAEMRHRQYSEIIANEIWQKK